MHNLREAEREERASGSWPRESNTAAKETAVLFLPEKRVCHQEKRKGGK